MSRSIADALEAAATLIEPEGKWTQGVFARDINGNPVRCEGPDAKCFCAIGALYRVSGSRYVADPIIDSLGMRTRKATFAEWNDDPKRKQAKVVAKLREAAAMAREQGK